MTLREGEEGAGLGARPAGHVRGADGRRSAALLGGGGHPGPGAAGLDGADRGARAAAALGARVPARALGLRRASRRCGGSSPGYRERELPLSALHLDIDHYDGHRVFTVDRERFPDLPGLAEELREDGVRLVSIVDPAVKARAGERGVRRRARRADAFVRDAAGRTVRGVVWPGECGLPGLHRSARCASGGAALYAERLAQGFAGVWHDMNEPVSFAAFGEPTLPRSARHALEGRGGDHREAHNVYGLAMARAGVRGAARAAARRSGRSSSPAPAGRGCSGTAAPGPGTWRPAGRGCGPRCRWCWGSGCAGCRTRARTSAASTGAPSPELYLRWFQLGAYLPLFRTHSAIAAGRREPWEFGPEVLEHARAALRGAGAAAAVLRDAGAAGAATGAPYVRPLWWGAPEDRALRDCEDAFLLGRLRCWWRRCWSTGADRRAVRLPRGRWYDTATGAAYEGPGQVLVDAPLSRIPVLARAGAVLPVRGADGGLELEVWAPARGRTRGRAGRAGRGRRLGGAGGRAVHARAGAAGGGGGAGRRGGPASRVSGAGAGAAEVTGLGLQAGGAGRARSGPRTRRGRPGCAGGRRVRRAAQQVPAVGLVRGRRRAAASAAGRSGRRPKSSRWPSG